MIVKKESGKAPKDTQTQQIPLQLEYTRRATSLGSLLGESREPYRFEATAPASGHQPGSVSNMVRSLEDRNPKASSSGDLPKGPHTTKQN